MHARLHLLLVDLGAVRGRIVVQVRLLGHRVELEHLLWWREPGWRGPVVRVRVCVCVCVCGWVGVGVGVCG